MHRKTFICFLTQKKFDDSNQLNEKKKNDLKGQITIAERLVKKENTQTLNEF